MHQQTYMQILNGGIILNNQIDLARIYGIDNTSNNSRNLELSNFLTNPDIPSLEQIAQYNLASRGINVSGNPEDIGSNSSINQDYPTGVPYDADYNLRIPPSDPTYVSTPTTALNNSLSANMPSQDINQAGNIAITDFSNPFPVTAESIQYLNGFIRTQIGRRITVTFLIGSNTLEEKTGFLLGVGANYILINELDTNDLTACDFYNIKFIRFYY